MTNLMYNVKNDSNIFSKHISHKTLGKILKREVFVNYQIYYVYIYVCVLCICLYIYVTIQYIEIISFLCQNLPYLFSVILDWEVLKFQKHSDCRILSYTAFNYFTSYFNQEHLCELDLKKNIFRYFPMHSNEYTLK